MSATLLDCPTRPGELDGARHVVLPGGIVGSGLPAAQGTCLEMGFVFDPWQVGAAKCILAKSSDGSYAADTIVLSIPRQVGKTRLIGNIVFADSVINPETLTVWTAHRFPVALETFTELKAMALSEKMVPHVDPGQIYSGRGNESITFRNGSRIVFAARERGSVRGFAKVRRIILDEAQILSESAMSDLAPAQNQAINPQIILMGTPPKPTDSSETFTGLRDVCLAGSAEGTVYIEFSADEDSDVDDVAAWEVANPSLHFRTPVKAIRRLRKLLVNDDDFAREALGIWPSQSAASVIDMGAWADLAGAEDRVPSPVAFGLSASSDRKWSTIAMAGLRSDGSRHVEVVQSGLGTDWVVARVAELVAGWRPVGVAVSPDDPIASLIPDLEKPRRNKLVKVSNREMAQGCGMVVDGISEGTIRHSDQRVLTIAAGAARRKRTGETWVWGPPPNGETDVSPLKAVTAAVFALAKQPAPKKSTESRRAVVI